MNEKKNTKIMLYHVIVDEILPVRLAIANNNVNFFLFSKPDVKPEPRYLTPICSK